MFIRNPCNYSSVGIIRYVASRLALTPTRPNKHYTRVYLVLSNRNHVFPISDQKPSRESQREGRVWNSCCLCSRNAYGHLELYYLFVLDCYAWYIYGTMDGRRAETGATLSANHVYPVGGVAHEARR